MKENIETKDVQRTEYLDKNGLDMLWAKFKENTQNQVEVERNRAVAKENSITNSLSEFVSKTATDDQSIKSKLSVSNSLHIIDGSNTDSHTTITCDGISNADNNANHVYATDGSLADLTQYAKKSEISAGGNVKDIVINGESIVENNVASIAFSTKNNVGVVQVGDGLNVNPFGTISVDTTALTALQKKVAANTTAISGKQDAGRYIPYEKRGLNDDYCYIIAPYYYIECRTDKFDNGKYNYTHMSSSTISLHNAGGGSTTIDMDGINISSGVDASNEYNLQLYPNRIESRDNSSSSLLHFELSGNGLKLEGGRDNKVLTSNGSTIDITKYALNKTATKENFGIVKVGDGLSVTDGVISVDSKLFALDMVSYGVEWDTTVADPACTRIGNPLLHKQLPIQSEYKGCLVKNGKVNYYLDPNDWSKKADGTPSVLDGTDGDIMVHIPKFYGKSGSNVNKRWVRISTTQVDSSWVEIPEMFVSAYRITTFDDSGTPKIASVVNTTANYRGGLNRVNYDQYLDTDKFKTDLGKPRTNVSREKMRTMATNSGQELLCYEFYKWIFYWAYVIEYANFNSQKEFNSELTSDGYHQGGLGSGLTTLNYQKWGSYNGHNPITPCGYTNEFGNFSGEKTTSLKLDSEQTGTAIHINRWRGFENPFGDIYTNLDGIVLERDAHSSDSNVYTTSDSSKFGDDTSVMTIVGSEPNSNGIIMEFDLDETGEIIPKYMVNSALKYKCDYHICDISAGKRTLKVGGCASNGNDAGLCNLDTSDTANAISSFVGFRSVIRA